MATLEIELQPQEQARLRAEADREGLPLADWARQRLLTAGLSGEEAPPPARVSGFEVAPKPLWEIMAELDAIEIPVEDRACMPHDGSFNYKHYLYGAAKVELPKDAI